MDEGKEKCIIYTDGSSRGNPGPGGWGAIVAGKKEVVELGGGEARTTNNRMELMAALGALREVADTPGDLTIYADSSYVINGMTSWVARWKLENWMTARKKPVENSDLWKALAAAVEERRMRGFGKISWHYVAGHAGIAGNERADAIATTFADGGNPDLFRGLRADYSYDLNDRRGIKERQDARRSARARSRSKPYSYVSFVGGVFERHSTWESCEARVRGVPGAKFKKAMSREEEDELRKRWSTS